MDLVAKIFLARISGEVLLYMDNGIGQGMYSFVWAFALCGMLNGWRFCQKALLGLRELDARKVLCSESDMIATE